MGWRESLLALPNFAKGHEFRHGVPFVKVSSLARQYYCELKVDHQYAAGDIPTAAKEEGTFLHEQLLVAEPVSVQRLIEGIQRQPIYQASFPVGAKVGEIVVVGIPDLVVFLKGKPRYLVELKTTASDPGRLWRDEVVQAKTYGLLMDLMGFDCSQLDLVIVRLKREVELSAEDREKFFSRIVEVLQADKGKEAWSRGDRRLSIVPYDRRDADKDVLWAQDYWLGRREPVPTKKPAKCRACEHATSCRSSLAET